MYIKRQLLLLTCLAAGAGAAHAGSFDFEGVAHGHVFGSDTPATLTPGVRFSVENRGGGPNLAVAFDSTDRGTRDSDLEGPGGSPAKSWAGGNLASNTVLGNLLIIQENSTGCGDGICDLPDDEGSRPSGGAGDFVFEFDDPITEFGFDLVDVEGSVEPGVFAAFFNGTQMLGQLAFDDFQARDGALFGDNSANTISPITAAELGGVTFDKVVLTLGGSGAVDNLLWTPHTTEAPEPTTLGLAGLALLGFGAASRRRRERAA